MSDDERQPIQQVLPHFKLHPLEPGWTALQAFVLVKSLNEEGRDSLVVPNVGGVQLEELLGALVVQVETLKRKLTKSGEDEDPDRRDD